MANRFSNPYPDFWSSTAPYASGVLRFYATGSSTPLAYYTNAALSTGSATTHTLNSAGRPTTDIWLQSVDYKVTLEDSSGNIIWTADPVRASDFASMPLWIVGSGNPNGSVAGTAGSSGVMPTKYWDYTNGLEYTCTTTGNAAAAVWTALNSTAATPAVPQPQGRLTLTSATPVLAADVADATAVYYTPYTGNLVPLYNGTSMVPTEFAELTLTLVASHTSGGIYDVFVFSNAGVVTIATGPVWTTLTPGSGARGTGAGTTQLSRVKGLWVNTVSMTARNSSTTYTVAANRGTYVGTIYINGTGAGQCTCHVGYGQSRKWGVWNAFNRVPILMKAGDATASWAYVTLSTIRASNAGTTTNAITVFQGLPEEYFAFGFDQKVMLEQGAAAAFPVISIGIGYNSTTAFSGQIGTFSTGINSQPLITTLSAKFNTIPSIGINTITANEQCSVVPTGVGGTDLFYGTETNMLLSARWNG